MHEMDEVQQSKLVVTSLLQIDLVPGFSSSLWLKLWFVYKFYGFKN